jgi:hypothetical protein
MGFFRKDGTQSENEQDVEDCLDGKKLSGSEIDEEAQDKSS